MPPAYPEISQDLQLPALGQRSRVMRWMQKTVMGVKKITKEENRT